MASIIRDGATPLIGSIFDEIDSKPPVRSALDQINISSKRTKLRRKRIGERIVRQRRAERGVSPL